MRAGVKVDADVDDCCEHNKPKEDQRAKFHDLVLPEEWRRHENFNPLAGADPVTLSVVMSIYSSV